MKPRALTSTRLARSLSVVVGKAHGHHIGKELYSVACLAALQNTALVTPVSFYALSVQYSFLCWSVVTKTGKSTSQRARNLVRRVVSPSSDSS